MVSEKKYKIRSTVEHQTRARDPQRTDRRRQQRMNVNQKYLLVCCGALVSAIKLVVT